MDKLQSLAVKEITWREYLARHASNGKSITAFCRDEDISQANFYAWRTKLRGGAIDLAAPSADRTFIDLGAVSRPAAAQSTTHLSTAATAATAPTMRAAVNSSSELRIELGGGIVLTITRR